MRKAANPALQDHRWRPAPHRHGRDRRPATWRIQPGTDVSLFNGMLHLMLWEGWTDAAYIAAHTSGLRRAQGARCATTRPTWWRETCGIDKEDLLQAAPGCSPTSAATLSLYCQGLNQSSSGHREERRPHQPAPGDRPDRQAGRRALLADRPAERHGRARSGRPGQPAERAPRPGQPRAPRRGRRAVGVPSVPEKPGKTAVEMFQAAADGEIRALWIACTNPAQSLPDQATVRRALERGEFVVVQEAFATTATCDYADLLLPATTWGEKDGTVTNSERRIAACAGRGRARRDAPRLAWLIAADFRAGRVSKRRSCGPLHGPRSFPTPTPRAESIWNEHREATRGRDLDITGLSYAMLDAAPQQWPLREGESRGPRAPLRGRRLPHAPTARARFADIAYQPVAEPRDARYPFSLTTGRLRDQWHGMSRTGTLGRLFGHVAEPSVQMHPQDMARRQLRRRRPGARHLASAARIVLPVAGSTELGAEPGLHRHALGRRIPERPLQRRRSAGRRQRAHHPGLLPRARSSPSSSTQPSRSSRPSCPGAPAGRGLAAGRTRPCACTSALRALMPASSSRAAPWRRRRLRQARTGTHRRALPRRRVRGACLTRCWPASRRLLALRRADSAALRRQEATASGGRRGWCATARRRASKPFLLAGDTRAEAWIKAVLQDRLPPRPTASLLKPGAAPAGVAARGRSLQLHRHHADRHRGTAGGHPGTGRRRLGSAAEVR